MASLMNSDDWTLVAVLGVPHCLYAFIWFLPTTFIACCCGAEPVGTFYKLAATLKGAALRLACSAVKQRAHAASCHWAYTSRPPRLALPSRPVRRILPLADALRPAGPVQRDACPVGGVCGAHGVWTGAAGDGETGCCHRPLPRGPVTLPTGCPSSVT